MEMFQHDNSLACSFYLIVKFITFFYVYLGEKERERERERERVKAGQGQRDRVRENPKQAPC